MSRSSSLARIILVSLGLIAATAGTAYAQALSLEQKPLVMSSSKTGAGKVAGFILTLAGILLLTSDVQSKNDEGKVYNTEGINALGVGMVILGFGSTDKPLGADCSLERRRTGIRLVWTVRRF